MYYDRNTPAPVSSPYGTPTDPRTPASPRRGRGIRFGFFGWLLPFLGVLAMVFGLPYLVGAGPDVEVQNGTGFAKVDGRDVALVPYDRTGGVDMWSDMFQLRLAAVDLATGETVWDTQLADALAMDAKVLVAGEEFAYLTTGDGLIVVELDDGGVAASYDEIDGLGESYLAAFSAYGYDERAKAVVVLDRDGGFRTIAVDTLTARPADAGLARAWSQRLGPDGHAPSTFTGEDEALLEPDRVLRLLPIDGGTGVGVNLVTDDGRLTRLGDRVFYEAQIVIDETAVYNGQPMGVTPTPRWAELTANSVDTGTGTPAGLAADLFLLRHKKSEASDEVELSVLSVETGEVVNTLTSAGEPGGAVCRPDGTVLIPVRSGSEVFNPDQIAVIDPAGEIDVHDIGDTGLFGGV